MSTNLIINDPVYGFISVRDGLLRSVISHPVFQRLDRIRQLGMGAFVYPGARHTRKQHSLGAYHLMHSALMSLADKGTFIFESEAEAAEAAILLHDVGHGPFSHVFENVLVEGISHEVISLLLMERINRDEHGALSLAISIYKDEYPKPFLHELISSQLDTDRLDYLCRDSFYTGVREGNIGAARIVKMLDVHEDRLVVDVKGLYSVENYLMTRRLMYWQVYLHKTVLAAEALFRSIVRRAKMLATEGRELFCSPALKYFLYTMVSAADFYDEGGEALRHFVNLDDSDFICAIKTWQASDDRVLSLLSQCFINRRLFKVEEVNKEEMAAVLESKKAEIAERLELSTDDAAFFATSQEVKSVMYSKAGEGILMSSADGGIHEFTTLSNVVRGDSCSEADSKSYVFSYRL